MIVGVDDGRYEFFQSLNYHFNIKIWYNPW